MDSVRIPREDFDSHPLFSRLRELHDVPPELFVQGNIPHITLDNLGRATPRILTIVGSRNHSHYGKEVVEHLVQSLAGYPIIIISGLALGIDALAHKASLTHHLTTIAVPGSGLHDDVLYPRDHVRLAKEILDNGGALCSPFADTVRGAQWTFPARNRIMAALSDAIIVIEAKKASGTMITARMALELGKDIGVVPGSIFSPLSEGSHELLIHGATPITSSSDILSMLSLSAEKEEEAILPQLTAHEEQLYTLLISPMSESHLKMNSSLSTQDYMIALTGLEVKGVIVRTLHEVRRNTSF